VSQFSAAISSRWTRNAHQLTNHKVTLQPILADHLAGKRELFQFLKDSAMRDER
jgi:hypothetical protein